MDLLNVPLPTVSPEDLSHYQYFTEKKGLSRFMFIYVRDLYRHVFYTIL